MSISKQSWLISISLQHGGVTHTKKLKFGNRTTYTKAIYIQKNASIHMLKANKLVKHIP